MNKSKHIFEIAIDILTYSMTIVLTLAWTISLIVASLSISLFILIVAPPVGLFIWLYPYAYDIINTYRK